MCMTSGLTSKSIYTGYILKPIINLNFHRFFFNSHNLYTVSTAEFKVPDIQLEYGFPDHDHEPQTHSEYGFADPEPEHNNESESFEDQN